MMKLTCQRERFFLPEDTHYLNCAFMSPLSREVEEAGIRGIRMKRNPATLRPEDFFRDSQHVRTLFARLIHAPIPERIAIIPSVSYGMAIVSKNLRPAPGQKIVVPQAQFPSNIYPWKRLAEETKAELQIIPPPVRSSERGAAWNRAILEAIDTRTALLAIAPIHWADGTRFDLKRMRERTREVGAWLVLDGTQSIGAIPFDVQEIQPEALVCAGYKWLFGPYGIGLAYLSEVFDEGYPLEENWITRKDSEQFERLVDYQDAYQPGAIRYDVGERSNFILLPMLIAGLQHVLSWTPEGIQTYCRELMTDILQDLESAGFYIEHPPYRAHHLLGLRVPEGASMDRIKSSLRQYNVSVSIRGDAIRVSPHVYNHEGDTQALYRALTEAL